MTFADQISLSCARCAALQYEVDISTITDDGLYMRNDIPWMTDQIGSLVMVVPTECGNTYWGYTSIPPEGIQWWRNLKTLSSPNREKFI
jgi:hypothetical protein